MARYQDSGIAKWPGIVHGAGYRSPIYPLTFLITVV